jgi:hypothetical protein
MQKHENTLEFHSRLIEAAEIRFSLLKARIEPGIFASSGQFGDNEITGRSEGV